jgi:hypothetical protein
VLISGLYPGQCFERARCVRIVFVLLFLRRQDPDPYPPHVVYSWSTMYTFTLVLDGCM